MPEQPRRWLLPAVMVALAGVVFIGLLAGGRAPADRVDALASRLRCPVCQGVSVADSPSDSAEAMRGRIAELVAAGATDTEVEQHFVDRYGQWVLLDPRPGPRTWALWALPAVALAAGGLAVWRLRTADHVRPTPEQRSAVARALADAQGEDDR